MPVSRRGYEQVSFSREGQFNRLGQTKSAVMIRLPGSMIVQFLLLDELITVAIGIFPKANNTMIGYGEHPPGLRASNMGGS